MHSVISLLDDQHCKQVEQLWAEIASRFELRGIYRTPYPHFSYHVSTDYDLGPSQSVLKEVARETAVLSITTGGHGIFNGPTPVLYIPVVRTAVLSQLHERVWTAVEAVSSGTQTYYSPANWLPHITLAQHDLTPENLPLIMQWLNQQGLNWQVMIDNLSLIVDTDGKQELNGRHQLTFHP
jgi:2'-5' RNA ligase